MNFFDLKKQYKNLKPEINAAISRVLEGGVFIGGSEVKNFEKEMADFLGAEHAIGLNSGTDALYLALKALGVGRGDEVLVPDFTFIATAEVVAQCGAVPVFADIDPVTYNIDPAQIEKKITPKTKSIIPVHLYGNSADMTAIMEIARRHNLYVIEDAAQAIGTKHRGRFCGSIGDIGCFSFFPTKNLGAYGDGGMLATNNKNIANKIKLIRSHGSSPENKYCHLELGINSRLDAVQAAILNVKIKYLADWNKRRTRIAHYYNKSLVGVGDIATPFAADDAAHVYHQYTVRTRRRDELRNYLKGKGLPTMIYYPVPLHSQPAFEYLGYKTGDFPEAGRAAGEVLSLPIYPELSQKDQDAVIDAVKEFYEKQN